MSKLCQKKISILHGTALLASVCGATLKQMGDSWSSKEPWLI